MPAGKPTIPLLKVFLYCSSTITLFSSSIAKRELEEETGYKAETWVSLGEFYPAPAYSNEIVYPFLATGLYLENIKRDPDEFLNIIRMPIKEFEIKCMDGTIKDGRTLMTWMKYSSIK